MKPKELIESAHRAQHFQIDESRQHSGSPSKAVLDLPYYHLVPKGYIDQLRWRIYVRERAADDIPFRHAIFQACEEDILFWANSLCFVYEPRTPSRPIVPLNTWINQDDHLVWLDEIFGVRGCGVEKSRDESLTWDALLLFYKHWYFDKRIKMGCVSQTEEKVDNPEDSDALFWKLCFLHEQMPPWWRLVRGEDVLARSYLKFHNRITKSTILGYACTGNVNRGGRKTALLLDEFAAWLVNQQQQAFASTQYASNCRIFISTFQGTADMFYKIMREEQSTMLKIIADWKDNPDKRQGLYTSVAGHLKVLDHRYVFPADYDYVLDGKIRSPYYDQECRKEGSTPQSIARELDRDPGGSSSKIFSPSVLDIASKTCTPAYFRGKLDFTVNDWRPVWINDPRGEFAIWREMSEFGPGLWTIAGGPFVVGFDVAGGSGSSNSNNSAIEVFDTQSGEHILEYYCNTIRPVDFAQLGYVLLKWLCVGHDDGWAYANFENQGLNETFVSEIKRLDWTNCYRTVTESIVAKKRSDKIGSVNADRGTGMLNQLQRSIQVGEATIRSQRLVREFSYYDLGADGKAEFSLSRTNTVDPSDKGRSHGDCAIAAALAWQARCDRLPEKSAGFEEQTQEKSLEDIFRKLEVGTTGLGRRRSEMPLDFRWIA